jgi:site-specific recombinase XerC
MEDVLVAETLAGLKVKLARPKQPKQSFTVAHIQALIDSMDSTNLTDVRNVCLMVLAFYAFLRFDEVARLKYKHVYFHNTHTEITIESAKNDQLRLGNVVVFARLPVHCSVGLLEHYIALSKCNTQSSFSEEWCLLQKQKHYMLSMFLSRTLM